jgi:aldose 1-epimerase
VSRVRLQAGELELELAPAVGGSVAAFRAFGEPVFRPTPAGYADVLDAASFPLVPFCNRIRDGRFRCGGREVRLPPNLSPQKHPLHGHGWRGAWTVERAGAADAELAFVHAPGPWPWAYEARQVFALDDRGATMTLGVTNRSGETMPAGLGFHPYFPTNAETVLATRVTEVRPVDAEVMPTGIAPARGRYDLRDRRIDAADLDNGYEGWSGEAEVRWPDRRLAVRITAGDAARRLQVYAPPEGGVLCVEPVTHTNDAFSQPEGRWAALGLRRLPPGAGFELQARFEPRRL